MGISSKDLDLLLLLKENGQLPSKGAVIEIGAQQCSNSFLESKEKINNLGKLFGVSTPSPLPQPLSSHTLNGLELLPESAPPASIFWKWLGFHYKSVDLDESHESVFIDLNYDDIPKKERGKYQIATNYGTTEHVANQLNAFKIIHELTSVGGIMLHHLPAQGMQNHGLINYNAKFFWMLARSNQYEWLFIDYSWSNVYQELHKDVADCLAQYVPDIRERGKDYKMTDGAIMVALKKVLNSSYVAPLDVQTGTKVKNRLLKKRYWSVFT